MGRSVAPSKSRRPLSLYLFVAWAFVLAFNTGVILWDITGPLSQLGRPSTVFGWLSLLLAFVAPFGFGASVYGLWGQRPWGRRLFLMLSTLFFGINLAGVWLTDRSPLTAQAPALFRNTWLASARYGLSLIIPLIYFNLRRIKASFQPSINDQTDRSASQPS